MAPGAFVRRLAETPVIDVEPEGVDWHPLQHYVGLSAFGANVFVARRHGAELVAEHDEGESGQEELYFVLSGRAEFVVDGECHEVGGGSVVAVVEPRVRRSARALDEGTALLVVGAPREGRFRSTWRREHFAEVARA